MTKADIVEALRCAADLCGTPHPRWRFTMFGSSVSRAADLTGVSFRALEKASIMVGVNIMGHVSEDSKRSALLEAAQRIEESE